MTRFFRGVFIVFVALRYGLDELVLTSFQKPWLRVIARIVSVGRNLRAPRGQRLREALERLGPIFVKFGQVLSTRRDLLRADIADGLARLQDRVPPFDSSIAIASVGRHSAAGQRNICQLRTRTRGNPVRPSRRCISRCSRTGRARHAKWPSRFCAPACCRSSRTWR